MRVTVASAMLVFSAEPTVPMAIGTERSQPLAQEQPHAPGGRMHQHRIARLDRIA